MHQNSSDLTLRKAFVWITLSTLLISGSCALGLLYFRYVRDSYSKDDRYRIVALVQTCCSKESVNTAFLAEVLGLSVDQPSHLFYFNTKEAKKRLLDTHIIQTVEVKKIKPGTIYVDYSLRKPVAYLAEYTNTAIDEDGVLFPFKPFYTPKNIPEIVLGFPEQTNVQWGVKLEDKKIHLAFSILKMIQESVKKNSLLLQRIDVSKAFAPSYGQREIVVMMEDRVETYQNGQTSLRIYPIMLRLNTNSYPQQLANAVNLCSRFSKGQCDSKNVPSVWRSPSIIIDARIPQLAFIGKME